MANNEKLSRTIGWSATQGNVKGEIRFFHSSIYNVVNYALISWVKFYIRLVIESDLSIYLT